MTRLAGRTDSPAVRALIERLYAVFDEPDDLLARPRLLPERENIVAEAPKHDRRNLPGEVLEWFLRCLVSTIGPQAAFRHYLPALIEDRFWAPLADDGWMLVDKIEAAAPLLDPPDPYRGMPAARHGATYRYAKRVDFISASERALAAMRGPRRRALSLAPPPPLR